MRIAVIGSGISGLGAAYLAHFDHQVTLYEITDRIGGHSNTVEAVFNGQTIPVDTGLLFITLIITQIWSGYLTI